LEFEGVVSACINCFAASTSGSAAVPMCPPRRTLAQWIGSRSEFHQQVCGQILGLNYIHPGRTARPFMDNFRVEQIPQPRNDTLHGTRKSGAVEHQAAFLAVKESQPVAPDL
jgi:hypothetical protein